MSRRKQIESPVPSTLVDHVRLSERTLLVVGDRFRVRGGPYWIASDGTLVSMGHRGIAKFMGYDEQQRVIVAYIGGGVAALPVGEWVASGQLGERYRVRAYRFAKCRRSKRERLGG